MANGLDLRPWTLRNWRRLVALCLACVVLTGLPFSIPSSAWAQDEAGDAATEEGDGEGDAEPEPAAKSEKAAAPDDALKSDESFLSWLNRASGIFGYCIGIESFILVGLVVVNAMSLRRETFIPAPFVEAFEQKLQSKDYQGAYELSKKDESFLARVLAAGLGRLSRGYDEAIEAMQEVGEEENMALDHKLSYIGMVGTTAPMFGLLGTVQGMIASFSTIEKSVTTPKPSELAGGISMALVTTMEGLIVAIPAVIFFGFFRNRLARIVLEVGMVSEGLMGRFAAVGKRPPAAAGAAPAPAAPASPE